MTKTMVESMPPNPNSIEPPATAGDPPPPPLPPTDGGGGFLSLPRRPGIRLTTEFDSDSSIFFNKISCKLLDSLAKLKLSFQNNDKGEISEPQLALTSKYLSLHYDLEEHNALIKSSFDVGPALHLRAAHDVKAQQGEVAIVADLAGPAYKFELVSAVPSVGLPKATFNFPLGEISLEEKEEEEVKKMLSINGIVKGHLLNGVCTAQYEDENINLRYLYKVGDESGKAKTAPMKAKIQFMLQVPQDDIKSSALMFRVKKSTDNEVKTKRKGRGKEGDYVLPIKRAFRAWLGSRSSFNSSHARHLAPLQFSTVKKGSLKHALTPDEDGKEAFPKPPLLDSNGSHKD
ncbi:hypothetical protein TEA_004158 [Camellia sinensis var. sinensis]|uniref:Uncharacterized protein n=1 Tax=Camellia sinensis var. sinensis TaxID=542762 RepID=A0A4S4E375_CAMSN|nr:hypothetical protein TEA_004158 [Camellia sinensis var. sinensis]